MAHKFDPKHLERLDRADRRQMIDIEAVFSSLPLSPNQSVADIGCGTGFFALPLSRRIPEGKVYALDISEEMLERLRQKAQEGHITNIEALKSGETDFPLPPGSMDGVLLAFVLHEQEDRIAFLKKVKELARPGAWVGVVEWVKREMSMGPPLHERIDPSELSALARRAGLELVSKEGSGYTFYHAVLQRPEGRDETVTTAEVAP